MVMVGVTTIRVAPHKSMTFLSMKPNSATAMVTVGEMTPTAIRQTNSPMIGPNRPTLTGTDTVTTQAATMVMLAPKNTELRRGTD